MAHVAELGRLTVAFPIQPRLGIGGAAMRFVRVTRPCDASTGPTTTALLEAWAPRGVIPQPYEPAEQKVEFHPLHLLQYLSQQPLRRNRWPTQPRRIERR